MVVYQMDVKTAFLNGNMREEVCVSLSDRFVDPDNPNHVYKLKKALYGLKQAPRVWYDMLSLFLISQDFSKGLVDPTLFIHRNENELLLDSSIALTAFVNADHAGCQDTRRSTSGSLQFMGDRLINWSSKRQKSVAISSTEAECIALTMDMTIDQQVALDEALVPHASQLRIGKINFRLRSEITSKELTLQVVYDVLRLTPFYKAFLVTTDNVDFAYLQWEDFVYQFKHKDAKKSNEMYYPRNSAAYKEYYAIASGAAPPKTKACVRKTQSSSDTTMPLLTAAGTRLLTSEKGKQPAKSSKAKDEGTGIIAGVLDVSTDESDEEISWKSSDEDDDDVEDSDDESNDDESHVMNVGGYEGPDAEDDKELYRDVNINLEGRDIQMTDVHITQVLEDTHVTLTPINQDGQQHSSSVSSQFVTSMLNPSPDTGIDSLFESTHWVDVPVTTTVVPLLVTAPTLPPPSIPIISKTLEANFFKFMKTNQFAKAVSFIHAVQLQFNRLQDEAQAENEDFLNKLDENIQKIIKEQVKEQVKVQVSKILPKCEKIVNEQLEAEVLTRASNSSKAFYDVIADLSELELKKILIEKIESKKSIHRSDEQRNLYKALVDAFEYEEPSAGQTGGLREYEQTTSESALADEPMQTTQDLEEPSHQEFKTGAADDQPVAEASQHPECELMDTPVDFSTFVMNWLKVDTLTLELIAGPTYELIKGSCKILAQTSKVLWICGQQDSARDVYSKRRIIAVTELQIVEWHNYKHLDWMTGKLTNLTIKERFAFNVSLRMFTRSIVIQRRVEDLQLGVESYQKKLKLTKPDTHRSDLKRKEAYTAYSNPRGFIYQNKDKQNKLMRIDKLHKFSE
nr:copia protein [Tanacetum cinerariifolium]